MVDVNKIEQLLQSFVIDGKYHIDPLTGIINVKGDVTLIRPMQEMSVQFGVISGDFSCKGMQLTTLKGAPQKVEGYFDCDDNKIKDLSHAPSHVGGDFLCDNNKLVDLSDSPLQVGGSFYCSRNLLKSLQGAPRLVGEDFFCRTNYLTSLVGCPTHVPGGLCAYDNPFQSLVGAPDHVGQYVEITYEAQLPLLRLCMFKSIMILDCPEPVNDILHKYAGQGRPGALLAAAELIRARYVENARW